MEQWKNLSLENLTEKHEGILYNEEWKPIIGYEGLYEVSSFGRIKGLGTPTGNHVISIKSQRYPKNGYLLVSIWKGNMEKKALVHRLVAMAFIDNPENKKTVNHKKGIKTDNRFHQLEWATQGENAKHAFRELGRKVIGIKGGLHAKAIPVNKFTKDRLFLERYESVTEAANSVEVGPTAISAACRGKYKTIKGFKWEYAKEDK